MSAAMTLQRNVDEFAKLKALLLLADPIKIQKAEEEGRKQIILTQEELGRVAEAKAYIAKHTALVAEIENRESALAIEKTQLELDKKQYANHVASENTRLETFAAVQTAKEAELAIVAKNQLTEADRLRGLGIDMNRQHQDAMSAVQRQEVLNTSIAQANAVELERLNNWEATLKAKAQRIKQEMANF